MLEVLGKLCTKYNSQTFTKGSIKEMYPSINEQLVCFQNGFGVLPRLCKRNVRRHFLILKVSAGSMTLCRGHHDTVSLGTSQYVAGNMTVCRVEHDSVAGIMTLCRVELDNASRAT